MSEPGTAEYVENTLETIPEDAKAMGLLATGRRFETSGALFARFDRGRCVETWSV